MNNVSVYSNEGYRVFFACYNLQQWNDMVIMDMWAFDYLIQVGSMTLHIVTGNINHITEPPIKYEDIQKVCYWEMVKDSLKDITVRYDPLLKEECLIMITAYTEIECCNEPRNNTEA